MPVRLVVPRSGRVIANRLRWARSPVERVRGLLAGPPLEPGEALLFTRARQVHTFGMGYAVDVCFCDRSWRVLHVVACMRPWRVTRWVGRASYAVEVPAGTLGDVAAGDQLSLEDRSAR